MLPLVHGFHSAPFKFSPLPLTHLDFPFRDSVGSHVLAAHRLLAAVAAAVPSRLVGSVVVYRSSIVLTELPPLLARFSALVASHQCTSIRSPDIFITLNSQTRKLHTALLTASIHATTFVYIHHTCPTLTLTLL